jgi:hypothetical protein
MPGLPSIPDVIALREVGGMARPLATPDNLEKPAFVVGAIVEICPPGEGALRCVNADRPCVYVPWSVVVCR